jgi:hypothetical protein
LSRPLGVLAGFLAGVVLMLSLLSVAPSLHAHLHAHAETVDHDHHHSSADHDDLGCAVTLFQHGATAPLELPRLATPPAPVWIAMLPPSRDTPALSAPGQLLRPARGPPVAA